jgi:selenocysteine-specific elongation factor
VDAPVRAAVERAVVEHLRAFHGASPTLEGAEAAEVRAAAAAALRSAGAAAPHDLVDAILDELVRTGALARSGHLLRLPSHRGAVAGEDVDRVTAAVAQGEPTPPSISELRSAGFSREAVDAAIRAGALVRIAPDLVLSAGFVARAVEAVREAGSAGVTVSAIRQRLETSRKFAVPLLEHLDRTGVTRRSGDLRFARGT